MGFLYDTSSSSLLGLHSSNVFSILSKYPLCLRIKNSDDLETVMYKLDTFLSYECKGKKITKEYIYQYFTEHLETSVGKQIVDIVNNL